MNYVISIFRPEMAEELAKICGELEIPVNILFMGKGTAQKSMLELLGMENNEKRIAISMCNRDKTRELIKAEKRRMYLDAPGFGIAAAVPIKSIGGGRTVEYLRKEENGGKYKPELNPDYELVTVIANEGRADMVMDAARNAGARGGTVIHGKGTGDSGRDDFMNVSIAREKEVILIVAEKEKKTGIMQAIIKEAGTGTEANAIVFSMPVTEVAGFGLLGEEK